MTKLNSIIFVFIAPILILIINCDSNKSNPANPRKIIPASYTYEYSSNKDISVEKDTLAPDTVFLYKIISGDKTVFTYIYTYEQDEDITDGGAYDKLVFKINSTVDSFYLSTGNSLDSASCLMSSNGLRGYYFKLNSGYVSGNKINDSTWHVITDLSGMDIYKKYTDTTLTIRRFNKIDALFKKVIE